MPRSAAKAACRPIPGALLRGSALSAPCAQALHVAVLRRSFAAAQLLLDRGFPPRAKSEAGWVALYDAVAAKDAQAVLMLHTAGVRDDEAAYRRALAAARVACHAARAGLRSHGCACAGDASLSLRLSLPRCRTFAARCAGSFARRCSRRCCAASRRTTRTG